MIKNSDRFNWEKGFTVDFSLLDGLSKNAESSKRHISDMKGMFIDEEAVEGLIRNGNPLVYEFYEMGAPEKDSDLAFGTSITYPGRVGNEFFMTKGHFHSVLKTAEIYYCLSGHGYMLVENPEGDCRAYEMKAGNMVYVPPRYAHRSTNIGDVPFVTFFCFRGDAGHDYGSIKTRGYKNIIIEKNGNVEIAENPKYKKKA